MARSVLTKTNARHRTEGFAEMVSIFIVKKNFICTDFVTQNIFVITFDVSCMCQIKVPAQTKKVASNAHAQQALRLVLSEYVKI